LVLFAQQLRSEYKSQMTTLEKSKAAVMQVLAELEDE